MSTRTRTVGSPMRRAVDWEQRIDFPRLRQERLDRAKAALGSSELGAVLLFDPNNIRYVTSTHIGEWARDKNARFTLLARGADPILWDFGSAAAITGCSRRGCRRRASAPALRRCAARCPSRRASRTGSQRRSPHELRELGLQDEPLGVDMADLVTIEALQRAGLHVTDGSQVLLEARKIKTARRLRSSTSRPGSSTRSTRRSTGCCGPASTSTRSSRARTSCSSRWDRAGRGGERRLAPLQPAPPRLLRPAPATGRSGVLRHHPLVHGLPDVLLPHVQRRRRQSRAARRVQAVPRVARRGDRARPARHDTDRIAQVWPTAEELGFPDEETCFGLQFGHGIGVGLYESR